MPDHSQRRDVAERLYENYRTALTRNPEEPTSAAVDSPYLRRVIARHFPEDRAARIVDLGCGEGILLSVARQAGYESLVGVDLSPEQVARAQARGIAGVMHGDALQFLRSQADGSADVLLAFDVVEHIPRKELLVLLDECRRTLSPSGSLLIHTANAASPFFGRVRYGDVTHESAFTAESLRQLLFTAGFSKYQAYEDAPSVHGLKSMVRRALWMCLRTAYAAAVTIEVGSPGVYSVFSQNFLAVAGK